MQKVQGHFLLKLPLFVSKKFQ